MSVEAPARSQRAFEVICDQIREDLAKGVLKPGDRLASERDLAVRFGVSRGALREAFRSLEIAGVIRSVKGKQGGAFIQPAASGPLSQAVQDFVRLGDITMGEVTEARRELLDAIIRLACERADADDFARLRAIVEETRRARSGEAQLQCAIDYYKTLALSTHNRVFAVLVDSLNAVLEPLVRSAGSTAGRSALIQSRSMLLARLEARDCEGALAEMREHLDRTRRLMSP